MKTDGSYPVRKNNRLEYFDYSSEGAYFITICTQNKACILSHIVNEFDDIDGINVGDGFPVPQLTQTGYIVQSFIEQINMKYPSVFVDKYVIMPNHIHLLIYLADTNGSGTENQTQSPTIGNIIGWLKYSVTKQVNMDSGTEKAKIFQRSYHDHIIRNEKSYKMIAEYIEKNPLVWESDCFYQS